MTHTNHVEHVNNVQHAMTRPDLAHENVHDLIPPWLADTVPALFTTRFATDPLVHVKLLLPDTGWIWYLTEYDAAQRRAYGFVRGSVEECDYISLVELAAMRGPMGLAVERDLFWHVTPLSRVLRGAVR